MPRRSKKAAVALPEFPQELIDQFVTGPMSAALEIAASVFHATCRK